MRYVIDCSVAFKWEVPEPNSPESLRLRDDSRHGLHELLAPDIVPVEIANALFAAEHRGDIVPGRFEHHWANVLAAGPILDQSTLL